MNAVQIKDTQTLSNPLTIEDQVKAIANRNDTSKAIFLELVVRNRHTKETNLTRFELQLLHDGVSVIEDDFIKTFEELSNIKDQHGHSVIGVALYPRDKKSVIFKWNMSVLKVGAMAGFSTDMIEAKQELKRARLAAYMNKSSNPVRRRKHKVSKETKAKVNSEFNRSEFMKAFWAKRHGKKSVKSNSKTKTDAVLKLLNQVLKELKKSA